jgi:hypothetical protein
MTEASRELVRRPVKKHWLTSPESIRKLWWIFAIVLALTVVAQIFIHVHAYFEVDGILGFSALYGFFSCVVMVLFAKVLGWWIKRPIDYYPQETLFLWTVTPEDAPGESEFVEHQRNV